jgi:hypothetical protein
MEMAVRLIETEMETDGDGAGGTSPSRQDTGTVPAGCRNRDFYPPKFGFDGGGAVELFWKFC